MSALLFKLICQLMCLLPVRLAGAIGAGIGRIAYILDKRHRNIALGNLRRIYPGRDEAWRQRTARESFAELGRTMFELPHVFLRSKAFLRSRIDFDEKGLTEMRHCLESGQGVILAGCHYANWELGALIPSLCDLPSAQLYRTVRQKPLEELLKGWRERFGNRLHSRNESIRWLPKALKDGKIVGLMIDQHLSNGIPVPFLGHLAQSATTPALYARKHGTPIFSAIFKRIGHDFRFRIEFKRVDFPAATADTDRDLIEYTRITSDSFAEVIHERPEPWLWVHRRWLYLDEQEAGSAR